jgi:LAO/AO transport system kinase
VATTGGGVPDVVDAVRRHLRWKRDHQPSSDLHRRQAIAQITLQAEAELRRRLRDLPVAGDSAGSLLAQLAGQVAAGRLDPYTAADRLVAALRTREDTGSRR